MVVVDAIGPPVQANITKFTYLSKYNMYIVYGMFGM